MSRRQRDLNRNKLQLLVDKNKSHFDNERM